MHRHRYYLADVFTDRMFGGNPLAVFPRAANIPPDMMPQIARELNISETVFVFPPDDPRHTARIRIFTPGSELPFAGHPTIGTACILAAIGSLDVEDGTAAVILEEAVGPVPVTVELSEQRLAARFLVPQLPETGPPPPSTDVLAQLLSIDGGDVGDGDLAPGAASCGVPFLFVPVRDRATLGRVRLNATVWEQHIAAYWAPHVYVITADAELDGSTVRARMFAPAMGISEDPATGAAAAAIAGFLTDGADDGTRRIRIEQGMEIGRPSLLDVEVQRRDGAVTAVRVGGECVVVGEGEMRLTL